MLIKMDDLVRLFPNRKGINDLALQFKTISAYAESPQPKGIYIPLYEQGELIKAIENGSIAAVWDKKIPIPSYTPNQFIIFYTDDLWKGLMNMLELYREKMNANGENSERMTFYLFDEKDEKKLENHMDVAMMINDLQTLIESNVNEEEGI